MNVSNIASQLSASTQEAMETAAQTKAEAAKGDKQAILKLARQQATQSLENPQPPVTTRGSRSALDAKA